VIGVGATHHGATHHEADLGQSVLLKASGITKTFRADGVSVPAVRGVDLVLRRGEFAAIMGPSGSGKSTLLHLLGGLERPTSGEIWLDGRRVDGLSQAKWAVLRRRHIGFVFQFFNLVSNMTVADNVELAALMGGANKRQARERRDELLADLGLSAKADAAPARLSGGEQQRVALARALANRPSLLLADEPTGNLDSAGSQSVLRLITRAHADGQAILLVTHDARVACAAERVISLFDGMVADDAAMRPPRRPPAARPSATLPAVLRLRG
jgi:putative ABC transport system ATP-binding protein